MSLLIITASVVTGVIAGGWLTMVIATAAMSRSQEHMEKKVRYWQGRAQVARVVEEHEQLTPDYWPGASADSAGWPHHSYDPSTR
jgi:hypothetical protein